jgi:hypothetical protein
VHSVVDFSSYWYQSNDRQLGKTDPDTYSENLYVKPDHGIHGLHGIS